MVGYRVEIKWTAAREIEALEQRLATRILGTIEGLSSDPRPRGCRKLVGSNNSYRLRVGQYRVVYQVYDADHLITVFAIGHRRDIYR